MPETLVEVNVLAHDLANAWEVHQASAARAYIGVLAKDHPDAGALARVVGTYVEAGIRVSLGLGAGDPTMWHRVADAAALSDAIHVNQVLPAAGYTLGRIGERTGVIVNALIRPGTRPGWVKIGTGPQSSAFPDEVTAELAAALLADIGVPSVKFFPIRGAEQLRHVEVMARAATEAGIPVFEPTGGIDLDNVQDVVETCREAGVRHVIPHVYSSIIDGDTGVTRPADVERLVDLV